MVQIIQTNTNKVDFQSRIFEYSSWNQYITDMKNENLENVPVVHGSMAGNIKPRFAKIKEIKICDEYHLDMTIERFDKTEMNIKAYLVKRRERCYESNNI